MEDIKGYEGLYQISRDGMVWSFPTASGKNKYGKFLKNIIDTRGYYTVVLYKDKKKKRHQVHRLIASAYIENTNLKPCVNHKDGNKLNNDISNLEWCTVKENTVHAFSNGLINMRTEKNLKSCSYWGKINQKKTVQHTRKFTMQQVAEIKQSYLKTGVYAQVALLFNCSAKTIEKIVNNKSYKQAA